jgi:hypothetical protein
VPPPRKGWRASEQDARPEQKKTKSANFAGKGNASNALVSRITRLDDSFDSDLAANLAVECKRQVVNRPVVSFNYRIFISELGGSNFV